MNGPPGPPVAGEIGWFQKGEVRACVALEPKGWHMSCSVAGRHPTWEEQKDARYSLCPDDVVMAQILPPLSHYVNISETFHWWEIPWDFSRS